LVAADPDVVWEAINAFYTLRHAGVMDARGGSPTRASR
jgi:hypothetical protein